MSWKYGVRNCKDIPKDSRDNIKLNPDEGVIMVEDYGDDVYAVLNSPTELWSESKEELIETLKTMLKDLEKENKC